MRFLSTQNVFKNIICQDLNNKIINHLSANLIQRTFRNYYIRHTRNSNWKELRRLLFLNMSNKEFMILEQNKWVRLEWRTEPESWIFTAKNNYETLRTIIEEIKQGLW